MDSGHVHQSVPKLARQGIWHSAHAGLVCRILGLLWVLATQQIGFFRESLQHDGLAQLTHLAGAVELSIGVVASLALLVSTCIFYRTPTSGNLQVAAMAVSWALAISGLALLAPDRLALVGPLVSAIAKSSLGVSACYLVPALFLERLIRFRHLPSGQIQTPHRTTALISRLTGTISLPVLIAILIGDLYRPHVNWTDSSWPTHAATVLMLAGLAIAFPWWLRFWLKPVSLEQSNPDPKIIDLLRQTSCPLESVEVIPTEDLIANALAVAAVGSQGKILLTDRLLKLLEPCEVTMVILHEHAHLREKHFAYRMTMLVLLCVAGLIGWTIASTQFVTDTSYTSPQAILFVTLFIGGSIAILSWLSHRLEYEADASAVSYARGVMPMAEPSEMLSRAILKLCRGYANHATLLHPSAHQRTQHLRRLHQPSQRPLCSRHSPYAKIRMALYVVASLIALEALVATSLS